MLTEDWSSLFVASERDYLPRLWMLLHFYSRAVKYLLKKYATYQAISNNDTAILRYF